MHKYLEENFPSFNVVKKYQGKITNKTANSVDADEMVRNAKANVSMSVVLIDCVGV